MCTFNKPGLDWGVSGHFKEMVMSLQPFRCYGSEFGPNFWKNLVDSTLHFLKSNDGGKHQACKNR